MAELVPVPESLLSGEELVLVSPDDELADTDGLESGCGVGLTEGDVDAAAFFLAFLVVLAVGVGLVQLVLVAWLVAVLVALELAGAEVAEAGAVGVPLLLALALALPLALALALVLAAELLPPVAGLGEEVGELGGGVGELVAVLDVLADGVGEGDAGDDEHDAATAGVGWSAAVVFGPTAPPRGLPPPPWLGALPVLADFWPPRTLDTDELSAERSGGTEAKTTPTANTAQPRAMAGLISASRQSLGRVRPGAVPCPARPAFQRRTRSARKPDPSGTAWECLLA